MANKKPKQNQTGIAIEAMINEVEHYAMTHMFRAVNDASGSSRDSIDVFRFTDEIPLTAEIKETRDELSACTEILLGGLCKETQPELWQAAYNLDSNMFWFASKASEIGYYFGVLVGVRLMGATRAQLEELGRGLKTVL